MPRTKKQDSLVVTNWQKELAVKCEQTLITEKHMAGDQQFISIQQGQFIFDGSPLKNNQIIAVIADSIIENTLYTTAYNSDNIVSPECYALGRVESQLKPHELAEKPASEMCVTCPNYQWGSGNGKGKACKNKRRLALLLAGFTNDDGKVELTTVKELSASPFAFMRIPVTSVKSFSSYTRKIVMTTKLPLFCMVTKITAIPDTKTIVQLKFEPVQRVPDEWLQAVVERNNEAEEMISFPYAVNNETNQPIQQQNEERQTLLKF